MGRVENRAYLEAIRSRYRHAGRAGKSKILDEFCAVCGYQRKYAIRLLGTVPKQSHRRPGRQSQYRQPRLLEALRRIWLATDQMCGKRLVAAIPLWLPHDETQYGVLATDQITAAERLGDPPRHAAQQSTPHPHRALGSHSAWFRRGRHRCARQQFACQ
jgi:hypothetical protein